jgi:hypothetical protein
MTKKKAKRDVTSFNIHVAGESTPCEKCKFPQSMPVVILKEALAWDAPRDRFILCVSAGALAYEGATVGGKQVPYVCLCRDCLVETLDIMREDDLIAEMVRRTGVDILRRNVV